MLKTQVGDVTRNTPILLPVFNRFDHTNLNELTAKATYKGQTFDVTLPDLNPHDKGVLSVPAQAWENGNSFLLEFFDAEGRLIDAEEIAIGNPVRPEYLNASGNLKLMVEDTDGYLKLKGKGFEIPFNKSTAEIITPLFPVRSSKFVSAGRFPAPQNHAEFAGFSPFSLRATLIG